MLEYPAKGQPATRLVEDKMKVKVGNKIYDDTKEPVMVILSDEDKFNISHMLPNATKYLSYPDEMSEEEARKFMKI